MDNHLRHADHKLCQCSKCSEHCFIDPETQAQIVGQYQSTSDRQKHQRHDRLLENADEWYQHDIKYLYERVPSVESPDPPLNPIPPNIESPDPPLNPIPPHSTGITSSIPSADEIHTSGRVNMADLFSHRLQKMYDQSQVRSSVHVAELVQGTMLLFSNPPALVVLNSPNPIIPPNLDLLDRYQPNMPLIEEERWVVSSLQFLQADCIMFSLSLNDQLRREYLLKYAARRHEEIISLKTDIWTKQIEDITPWIGVPTINTLNRISNRYADWNPAILACYLTVCAAHLLLKNSLDATSLLLQSLKHIMHSIDTSVHKGGIASISAGIPQTAETMISHLTLEPNVRTYVSCQTCFKTYPLDGVEPYPETCSHQKTPKSQTCNSPLKGERRTGRGTSTKPIRLYLHHDLEDWIAQLYSRPDIEEKLDRDIRQDLPPDGAMRDICDSPEIQNFLGPDGLPFIRAGREGRLVFSLNMDGFNPHKNMEAGKKASIGAIYMVCLNLPADMRYDLQNIFLVGVIPGPVEPSKDEINHLLGPLVDDLLAIWDPGFYVVATFKYPAGRPVRGAVIPLVCDLLAARQMSGCASHASDNFCSYCLLKVIDMNTFDHCNWPMRTWQDHRKCAEEWRDAESEELQQTLYDKNGVRWSELLRLPYWDPTRFVVIDVMHALLLGLLKRHVRHVWGMDANANDNIISAAPHLDAKGISAKTLEKARVALDNRHYDILTKINQKELRYLCNEKGLAYGGRKRVLIGTLIRYRRSLSVNFASERDDDDRDPTDDDNRDSDDDDDTDLDDSDDDDDTDLEAVDHVRTTTVLGKSVLAEVRQDMAITGLPTWLSPPPKRPGEAKSGKLTADQWKTFCTVNLVITLNRLWGNPDHPKDPQAKRNRLMLDNFMHLVSAVKLASMRTMTPERIRQFTNHMLTYLTSLQEIYPWTSITPYHHIALHLSDFLTRFGPTHGWRCFTFERYNFVLQSTPTNNKFGDMERTIFKKFCRAQNLKIIMQGHHLPEALQPLVQDWQKHNIHDKAATQGTLHDDFQFHTSDDSKKKIDLLPLSWSQLLKRWIRFHDKDCDVSQISSQGQIKGSFKRSGDDFNSQPQSKNSQVYYRELNGDVCAGRIIGIFSHQRPSTTTTKVSTFIVLQQFKSLPPDFAPINPYKKFRNITGRVFLNEVYEGLSIVESNDLLHHFASYPIHLVVGDRGVDTLLALPLDKW